MTHCIFSTSWDWLEDCKVTILWMKSGSGERARNQHDITHEQHCQEATTGFWLPNLVFSFHEDTDMSNPESGPLISTLHVCVLVHGSGGCGYAILMCEGQRTMFDWDKSALSLTFLLLTFSLSPPCISIGAQGNHRWLNCFMCFICGFWWFKL